MYIFGLYQDRSPGSSAALGALGSPLLLFHLVVRWAPSRGEMSARCQPSVASGAKERVGWIKWASHVQQSESSHLISIPYTLIVQRKCKMFAERASEDRVAPIHSQTGDGRTHRMHPCHPCALSLPLMMSTHSVINCRAAAQKCLRTSWL